MEQRMVYVVDDDQAVRDSLAFVLDCFGYRCELFADPVRFLEQADSLVPGCLIVDYRMPGLTGFDLITALRGRIDWPALLMTSENGPALESRARDKGFAGYLRKPVRAPDLIDALVAAFATFEAPGSDAG